MSDSALPLPELVVDSVPDPVIAVDLNDEVVLWNLAAQELFGWPATEVMGVRLPTVPDETAWAERREWLEIVERHGSFQATATRKHRDGHLLDVVVHYRALRAGGRFVGVVGTCREAITEMRLRQVVDEREKFASLLDAMHDGLAVVKSDAVTTWNRAATELTGWSPADVLGRPPPLSLDEAATGMELAMPGDAPRWIQTVSTELPATGEVVYLIRDITEQRKLEQAKDLFFATTSHELKTPLTVVKGMASTLQRHWNRMPDADRSEALATILRRVDQLDLLIDRILVGSRVSAGVLEIQPGPVDLTPIVIDMTASFDAVSPNHTIAPALPDHMPLVSADRQAVDTILGHLLENAVKYSPGGGTVTVAAHCGADDLVQVDVSDEGVGIEGDLEQLLRPFVQGDRRVARRFGGVGIGLFIVKQLVEALGGTLAASNRAEGGACFSFTLPVWK